MRLVQRKTIPSAMLNCCDPSKTVSLQWPKWPVYNSDDCQAVLDVIHSNQLFAADCVTKFESEFARYTSASFAVGVGNATQGLHIALAALNIGVGDEVIVPNYSFISTASCVLMQNAIPVFVDCERSTLAPSAEQVLEKISSRTKAVIITHLWGFPCEIKAIKKLCAEYDLFLIEDCSHSHGAFYQNQHVGTFGHIGIFSLHQRKNLPVGDGGICIGFDSAIQEKLYRLRSFGHEELSYNYRMTEFAASLGLSRLNRLESENAIRRNSASTIDSIVSSFEWIDSLKPLPGTLPVYHAYIFLLDHMRAPTDLDEFLYKALDLGIPLKKTWTPLHLHPHFNPKTIPSRGLPWQLVDYPDFVPYSDQEYPVGDQLIFNSIMQLDIHPGLSGLHYDKINQLLGSFK
jgi:perosamine synthetase